MATNRVLSSDVYLTVARTSTHGSVELRRIVNSSIWSNTQNIYIVRDDDRGNAPWPYNYPYTSEYAYINMIEASGDKWWRGGLRTHIKFVSSFSGWYLQLSATYRWDVTIVNICCKSGRVYLSAGGESSSGSSSSFGPNTGSTSYPSSGIYNVPCGSSRRIGTVALGAGSNIGTPSVSNQSASAGLQIKCAE